MILHVLDSNKLYLKKSEDSGIENSIVSAANLDLYDLDLDLWQGSLDRKKII